MKDTINTGTGSAEHTAAPTQPKLPSRRTLALLLAVFSFLLYINTIGHGYVLDDLAVIKQNTFVKEGVSAIPKLLATPYLKGFKRAADTTASNDLYRPASLVMFAAEQQVGGDSPLLHHLVNILLFAGCVVVLFLFLDLLPGIRGSGIAFVAALIFAAHPIHTEVVANIKSRDELLCFFLAFASLLVFAAYTRSGKIVHLAGGALLYFVSLLSKETSAAFLIIIPLVFFCHLNSDRQRSIRITVGPIASFLIYIAIRYAVLIHYNANHTQIIDLMENELVGAPSAASRLATAILVLGYYIRLLFIPYPLSSDYAFNSIPFVGFDNIWVWITIILYCALAAIGIARLMKKQGDLWAFGILLFITTLVLFSNIVFLVGAVLAERFLFFASAGFCLAVALLLSRLGKARHVLYSQQMWLVLCPLLLVCSLLTFSRNKDWKDNYTLFSADAEKYPANARLWYNLGFEQSNTLLEEATDINEKVKLVNGSIADLQKAVAIYPNYAMAHNDLGKLFQRVQQYDSAEAHLKRSIALNPKDPVNKTDLGGLYFTQGNYRLAAYYCNQAALIEPENTEILNNLGLCYLMLHQYDSAMIFAGKVVKIAPDNKLAAETIAAAKKANMPTDQ